MPVSVSWDGETRKVIHLRIDGFWSWAEFYRANNTAISMMEIVRVRVNFILEARTDYIPPEALQNLEAASAFFLHPQAGSAVIVGTRGYLRSLALMLDHLYPRATMRLSFANSLDEARALLADPQPVPATQPSYTEYR